MFKKILIISFFLFLTISTFASDSFELSEKQSWAAAIKKCDNNQIRYPHTVVINKNISAQYLCTNGQPEGEAYFYDQYGNILMVTNFFKGEPLGLAAIFHPILNIFYWKNQQLISTEKLPLFPEKENSSNKNVLNGEYRKYQSSNQSLAVESYLDGVRDGFFSYFTFPAREQGLPQITRDKNRVRVFYSYYEDGLIQVYSSQNTKDSKYILQPANVAGLNCKPVQNKPYSVLLNELIERDKNIQSIEWLRQNESDLFKQNTNCINAQTNKNKRYQGRFKSIESTCYQDNFTGTVKIYAKDTGFLAFKGEFQNGHPINTSEVYSSSARIAKITVNSTGTPVELCAQSPIDKTSYQSSPRSRTGLWGISLETGTRENGALGLLYSPNFRVQDVGGAGYYIEVESLSNKYNDQYRVSGGVGFIAMYITGFGSVAVRGKSSDITGYDITYGLGLFSVNLFQRWIYLTEPKSLIGEVGVKAIIPFF